MVGSVRPALAFRPLRAAAPTSEAATDEPVDRAVLSQAPARPFAWTPTPVTPPLTPGWVGPPLAKVLFLSDLDGTWLSPDPAHRKQLDQGILKIREEAWNQGIDLRFGYITARPPGRVGQEQLPDPDWMVTHNGGTIHRGPTDPDPVRSWEEVQRLSGFDAARVTEIMGRVRQAPDFANLRIETVGHVLGRPEADDCDYMATFCVRQDSLNLDPGETPEILQPDTFRPPGQVERLVQSLSRELEATGMKFKISPIYPFHGQPYVMFDVAAPEANKGSAVDFLRERLGIDADNVIVAGDGGNDLSMMTARDGHDDGRRAIIVGANAFLRMAAARLKGAKVRPEDEDCAMGVMSGLREHLQEIAARIRAKGSRKADLSD
ncbi:MAG: HAD family hydrolase [Candidatus Eremiobacterota bacterium]